MVRRPLPRARAGALLLAVAMAVLVGSRPARAGSDTLAVPVTRQGDSYSSPLPATYEPAADRIHVGTLLAAEESRAYVALDVSDLGALPGRRVELVLREDTASPAARPSSAAAINACPAAGEIPDGRGDPAEVECDVLPAPGKRADDGTWTFDITAIVGAPSFTGSIGLVPLGADPAGWRVVFDTTKTLASAQVEPPRPTTASTAPPSGPPVTFDSPAPGSGGTFALPPVTPDPVSTGSGTPPQEAVLPPVVGSPHPDPLDSGSSGWPLSSLVLVPFAAGALAMVPRTDWSSRLRNRKEALVSLEQLKQVNTRLRLATAGSIVLAVGVLAMMTSAPTGGGGSADLAAVGAQRGLVDGDGNSVSTAEGDDAGSASGGNAGSPGGARTTATGPAGTGGPSATAGAGAGATDQGVKSDSIKIGVLRVDPGFAAAFGVGDAKVELVWKAYADEINARGGVHGRSLVIDIITIADPLDNNQIQQACRTAFADNKDFMMVSDQAFPGLADCAASFGRPLTDTGFGGLSATSGDDLRRFGGVYWTAGPSADRFVAQWVEMVAATYGTETKVGILNHYDESLVRVGALLTDALVARGFPAPSYFQHTDDNSTAAIQVANGVAQFKRDGVQLVMPVTNPIVIGIAQRGFTANNYRPEKGWSFSSIALQDSPDVTTLYDASQMNGAKGISWVRLPAEPENAECREIIARRAPSAPYLGATAQICHMIFQNLAVLERTGPDLRASTWAHAYGGLSTYSGNYTNQETFTAAKRDGADQYRVWSFNDGSFHIDTGWRT